PGAGRACPPPRAPAGGANTGTSWPAANPGARAAAVVATTNDTFPASSAPNSATTPGRAPSRPRTSEASARRSAGAPPPGAAAGPQPAPHAPTPPRRGRLHRAVSPDPPARAARSAGRGQHGVGPHLLQLALGLPQPLDD